MKHEYNSVSCEELLKQIMDEKQNCTLCKSYEAYLHSGAPAITPDCCNESFSSKYPVNDREVRVLFEPSQGVRVL